MSEQEITLLIRLLRKRGFSVEYLADTLSVSKPTIERWEMGRNLPYPALHKQILEELWRLEDLAPYLVTTSY